MMNRIAFNAIVQTARVKPTNRAIVPCRWQSAQNTTSQSAKTASQSVKPASPSSTSTSSSASGSTSSSASGSASGSTSSSSSGSGLSAGIAGGLTVLLGGYAWYYVSGTREVVGAATEASKKAQQLKDAMKDKVGDPKETMKYLRSATATLIPGSGPFLGKIFDQIEEVSKEHGDEVKKVFQETYNDLEKLTKEGGLDPQTASKAVGILQKRVKEIQDLVGNAGGDAFSKLLSDNAELRDKVSKKYKELTDTVEKAKEKKPEVEKLVKQTTGDLAKLFKDGNIKDNIPKAQELIKSKVEEAQKLLKDVKK